MDAIRQHECLEAYFRDVDHVDVKSIQSEADLRGFISGMLSFHPWWIILLYRIRALLVVLLGLVRHEMPDGLPRIAPQDLSFTPGDRASFFTVSIAKEDAYWVGETPTDNHLKAHVGVVAERLDRRRTRFHVFTAVKYLHWTGPVYFNLIRPFHHLVVRRMMKAGAAFCLIVLHLALTPVNAVAGERLAYYSDYFSFVGRDAAGYVAFALDNNRGVDESQYQAEHFVVMVDQRLGWVRLSGMGDYDNSRHLLARIPNSPDFTFHGRPDTGMTIRSRTNMLALTIDPVVFHLSDDSKDLTQKWGAADAVLTWKGRKIPGRIIYEYLVHCGWNRLSRTYWGTWDNFQGFYLVLDRGTPDRWADLYLRSQGDGEQRRTRGFVTTDDWPGTIHSTRFTADHKALNFGFYLWPQRWEIEVKRDGEDDAAPARLSLHQISRKNQGNWIVGGFAMSVVKGEFYEDGKAIPVFGFAELIK